MNIDDLELLAVCGMQWKMARFEFKRACEPDFIIKLIEVARTSRILVDSLRNSQCRTVSEACSDCDKALKDLEDDPHRT